MTDYIVTYADAEDGHTARVDVIAADNLHAAVLRGAEVCPREWVVVSVTLYGYATAPTRRYTDAAERMAIVAGASSLRLRAALLANRTAEVTSLENHAMRAAFTRHADVLDELASCYGTEPRS